MRVQTHNGCITIVSKKTGDHRTVLITNEVWSDGPHRVVSLLVGPDRFQRFADASASGIRVWRSFQDQKNLVWIAKALSDMPKYAEQAEFLCQGKCRMCDRTLTHPESIESGIGPICARKEPPSF